MRRNKTNRLISLVMVVAMLLSYIPGAVWAVDATTDIKAIQKPTGISIVEDYDDYVGANWLEMLDLPETVTVTLANNTTQEVPVTWDSSRLDTRTTGYYSLPGTLALPAGVTNGKNLTVAITVQVRQYSNLIANPGFEEGTANWRTRGLGSYIATDYPKSGSNALMFGTNAGGLDFWNTDNAALASRVALQGAGQYYFAVNVRQTPDATANVTNFYARIHYVNPSNGTTSAPVLATNGDSNKITVSKTGYVKSAGICTLAGDVTWLRIRCYASKSVSTTWETTGLRFDDVELVALKVALKAEPAAVAQIKTELLARAVILDYPKYVENWKSELNLPATVEVLTDNGSTVSVGVTWSYAGLDFTKYGKYTLVGKLDDSSFPNPKELTVQQTIYVSKASNIIPNGDFENGTANWSGWMASGIADPSKKGNQILLVKKSQMSTSVAGSMALYENADGISKLVEAAAASGAGQYYYAVDAMSAPFDTQTPARSDVEAWLDLRVSTAGAATNIIGGASTAKTKLSTTEWTTISTLVNMDSSWNWMRTDIKSNATAAEPGAIYLDNFRLVPINVPIAKGQEPAEIEEILEEVPVRAVVQDYDQYAGEFWQSALGLPAAVQVRTANGNTASVGVEWDYSTLNLKKTGKYILIGKLDASIYPNPNDLVVKQIIHVRDYINLLQNPSFEEGNANWSVGSGSYEKETKNYLHGISSMKVTTSANLTTAMHVQTAVVSSKNDVAQKELAAKIAYQGAGQYYFSAWAKFAGDDAAGFSFRSALLYKETLEGSNIKKDSVNQPLSTKNWVQAADIFNIPGNIAWARLDLYLACEKGVSLAKQSIYMDHAELIPLNVIVEQYEGAMEEVESIIPDRQIIQNYPQYIGKGYTTADLMLPETVNVRSTTGEIVKIEVKWDYSQLDLTKTGTYTVYGSLQDMRLPNPDGLTVQQKIRVVSKQNIFSNPSFEEDDAGWSKHSNVTLGMGNTSPVRDGDYSLKFETSRMDSWTLKYLQAFYNGSPNAVGQKIVKAGAGRYFFGGWAQGTASTKDIQVQARMLFRRLSTGDTLTSSSAPAVTLSTTTFTQFGDVIELPDDIYWARMDFYLLGTPEQMRLSTLYLDDFALIPLNVEVPNLTDIIDCEDVTDIYVHEGTSFEGLKLPEKLQVTLKNAQKFDLPVKWDTSSFNPNQIGEQTITGSLELGSRYKNPKNFVPTARIVVRAKGEALRQTIYISTSGSEDNDGLTPEKPKKEVTKVATYLQQGYNVKLKRGDIWYIPTGSISLKHIYGTEDAPIILGAYGSGDSKPIIAYMLKIENNAWKLVDKERNIYAADVSVLGQRDGITVHRCFIENEPFTFKNRTNYATLKEGQYCSYDKTLYVRMPEGKAPKNVEVTPYTGGHRILADHISNLTIENIHIKGGGGISSLIYIDAPTEHFKWLHCDITQVFYYVMMWETDDEEIHYKPEIAHCYIDANFNKDEGNVQHGHWATAITEGIVMRDGMESGWVHHNHIRNMSHAFITIESTQRANDHSTTGVRNTIIEDNLLEGGNARYARAFGISGGQNAAGIEMGRNNIIRRNRAYDMTTSSHLFGVNNLIYSNLISYVHCEYMEDGTLFDGKNAQPWGFDTLVYSNHGSVGNMLVNNTFYNVSGAIAIWDKGHTVYNNIYANNLIVNFTNDPAVYNATGAIYDETIDMQYVLNNGVYSNKNTVAHFVVDKQSYTAEDVNDAVAGYSDNIYADPKFVNADLTLMDRYVRQEFELSSDSPMRYAGLSLYSDYYKSFPMWERLKADYTDLNGVVYLAESPSIGAYSFCEKITGNVAEVGKLEDILARPGAQFEQLNLPDAVPAKSDKGIDVMLLTTWNKAQFDGSKAGTVTLTAELRNGPHTNLDINGKTASININIKDKLELLNITTRLENLTVLYGTSYEDVIKKLHPTLDVQEESGYREALPVTWSCETYNPIKPDVYTFKCILPEDMIANTRDFNLEVEVRVLPEISRGSELLVNPDFIDGPSAAPWTVGWGTGNFKVTQDSQYLMNGEPAAAIVTVQGRYASLQQSVLGQMQLMGDGKYLFKVYMRAYDVARPIDSSVACLKVFAPQTYTLLTRTKTNIGTDWVELSSVMDVVGVDQATDIIFHTSTFKSEADVEDPAKSIIYAGCSLVYLGRTDAEVEATLDSLGLTWNAIKGENASEKNVTSDLKLPSAIGTGSKITWTSSDESAISNDGKVTMGRLPKEVTLTATITYNGTVTLKKFKVIVPRDPELPVFTGSLTGSQTVNVGEEFKVTISTSSDKATSFNAYRFTLSFNTSMLEYVGISDPASAVEVEGGKLTISGIGSERPITDTITVTFRAKKSGMTEVKLAKLEMDLDPNASLEELPVMTVTGDAALIDVQKTDTVQKDEPDATDTSKEDNTAVIWIVIGLAAAALIAGSAIAIILIKKKKQLPPAKEA